MLGCALWLLMDERTRTMAFPDEHGVCVPGLTRGCEPPLPPALLPFAGEQTERTVLYSDTDLNGHMKSQKKDIAKSIIVLVVICLVTSAALAIVNHFTAPVSAANKAAREEAARKAVISEAASFEQLPTDGLPETVTSVYKGLDGSGNALGYIFTVEGKGFGGKIQVMLREAVV